MPHTSNATAIETDAQQLENQPFLIDCQHGLGQSQRALPCKWLYDEEGSRLFELICETREYYPSRTESALLLEAAPHIGSYLTPDTALVEFGSGASRKTRLLLDTVDAITGYVPIDISEAELARATKTISADYPWLELFPILGDFSAPMNLGAAATFAGRLGFFPGSTLGNFMSEEATAFLHEARNLLGSGSRLLLGIDLAKDEETMLAAYDDRAGVTAAFNLNLLARINRELDTDIDVSAFEHRAIWNPSKSRIEMHLACLRDQYFWLGEERFHIAAGDTIHTENSHKFDLIGLAHMFTASGWSLEAQWLSDEPSYALLLLRC